MNWRPDNPGYADEGHHPEVWFSPTEGYIIRSLAFMSGRRGELVRASDRHVVRKLPEDVELIVLPHEMLRRREGVGDEGILADLIHDALTVECGEVDGQPDCFVAAQAVIAAGYRFSPG